MSGERPPNPKAFARMPKGASRMKGKPDLSAHSRKPETPQERRERIRRIRKN